MTDLTLDRLKDALTYAPETGSFTWRRWRPGVVAGSLDRYGYRQIVLDGEIYLAHRLAWLYVHGCWPSEQIDHRNGLRDDNCIDNLREAACADNQQNVSKRDGATSRLLGVTWHKHARKWHAKIQRGGRKVHIGYFATEEAAHEAYLQAKARLHEFNPELREGVHGPPA
jgi:hypothetical protein